MGNTIGSSPRPVSTASTTRASSASAATASPTVATPAPSGPPDAFSSGSGGSGVTGPGVRPSATPEQIKNMSNDDIKKFTPEEIKGMSLDQFQRYTETLDKEGGVGMMNLDPEQRKAVLRKTIMKGLMEYFASQADKHTNFSAW